MTTPHTSTLEHIKAFNKWKESEDDLDVETIKPYSDDGNSSDDEPDKKDIEIKRLKNELDAKNKLIEAFKNNITFVYCDHCRPK